MDADRRIHEKGFDYLAERANVLMLVISMEGEIIWANRYANQLVGMDLAGERIEDVIVDFSGRLDTTEWLQAGAEERLLHIRTAEREPQTFCFAFQKDADRILAFGRLDAEELETTRKEVLKLNQELSNLTRELHKKNAQLKMLNEEKNRFLGMAAHDLRKPIGLVINYSEFLIDEAEDLLDAELFGFVRTIHASGSFMKRLVDDFLDVSAIEAGRLDLDLQRSSLRSVIVKSLELTRLQAQKKEVRLEVRDAENAPTLQMDAAKIEQAITNLVSNAIEHSDPGSQIVLGLSPASDLVTLSVQDSGPGIPPEELDKLFSPFQKTSVPKTSGEKSTGLGLLITRKIIEAHQGKIWVESTVGRGTTVRFELPIRLEKP